MASCKLVAGTSTSARGSLKEGFRFIQRPVSRTCRRAYGVRSTDTLGKVRTGADYSTLVKTSPYMRLRNSWCLSELQMTVHKTRNKATSLYQPTVKQLRFEFPSPSRPFLYLHLLHGYGRMSKTHSSILSNEG